MPPNPYLTVLGIIMQNWCNRTILTCLNKRKELTVTDERTDRQSELKSSFAIKKVKVG